MRKYFVPLMALAVVGLLLIRRSMFASNLEIILRDIALRGSVTRPRINITLGLQNATNQKGIVKSIVGTISWNGTKFANMSSFKTTEILPNAETKIIIQAEPDLLGAGSVIVDIFKKGFKGGEVNIDGTINFNNVNIPINVTKQV